MVIDYGMPGGRRKELVQALSQITGEKAKYQGTPSCAYNRLLHCLLELIKSDHCQSELRNAIGAERLKCSLSASTLMSEF